MSDNLLEAAKKFIVIYDEITDSVLSERLGSRSDTEMRKDANEAIAELRIAALRRAVEEEGADQAVRRAASAPPAPVQVKGPDETLAKERVLYEMSDRRLLDDVDPSLFEEIVTSIIRAVLK